MPEIGYQETYLARAFSRAGHDVRIITSTAISPTGKKVLKKEYEPGKSIDKKYGYEVVRFKPYFTMSAKVLCKGITKSLDEFQPDHILVLALAKLFPSPVINQRYGDKIIAVFGDAEEYTDRSTFKKKVKAVFNGIIQSQTKDKLYNRVVKYGKRIVLNIPETESYFKQLLSKTNLNLFEKKKLKLNLGFDPDSFYFQKEARQRLRQQYNIPDDACVLITSTRINRQKKIEEVVKAVSDIKKQGLPLHYIIIGFLNDDYEKELKAMISKEHDPSIFHCFPFLDHETIRQFYSLADIGLWIKAAISIQESMGTGLRVVLEKKDSVSHLLDQGVNGWYFEKGNMPTVLQQAVTHVLNVPLSQRLEQREKLLAHNAAKYSYDEIAHRMISN